MVPTAKLDTNNLTEDVVMTRCVCYCSVRHPNVSLDSGQLGENLSSEHLRNGSEADIQILSAAGYKVSRPPPRRTVETMEKDKNEVETFS